MNAGHLTSDSLFAQIPKSEPKNDLYDVEFAHTASNQDLIDSTYWILRGGSLSVEQALKVWELRLTLTLFNDQLALAKKEAVNLNNALYVQENPTTQPKSSPDTLVRSRHNSIGVVYPLTKNNNGLVGFLLLLMILRLKSIPNLILVNELYKLCYQLRLKGTSSESAQVQRKLTNLSYEVIVVLVITRNYFTILSFLDSLRHDVGEKIKLSEKKLHDQTYLSNISLLHVIITLLVWTKGKSKDDLAHIPEEIRDMFHLVDKSSILSLKHVLQNVPAVVAGPKPELDLGDLLFETLAELIWEKKISARIICCTLATWVLSNLYHTEIVEEEGQSRLVVEAADETDSPLDNVCAAVVPRWGTHINKMFGVE